MSACLGCAKARRRCGKQRPSCSRCTKRQMSCKYPPSKPSSFIVLENIEADSRDISTLCRTGHQYIIPTILPTLPFLEQTTPTGWFAYPETWTIDSAPPGLLVDSSRISDLLFTHLLRTVLQWSTQWVSCGSCPYIHHRLYRHRMPRAMQEAYLTLSAFSQRRAKNNAMIRTILKDRAIELVAEGLPCEQGIDALDHLGRVQALLMYQMMMMYDGAPELKSIVTNHMTVLENCLASLMEHVNSTTSYGGVVAMLGSSEPRNHLWYTWIIIESLRRTWTITSGLHGLYKFTQNPNDISCSMGATIFTTRRGFWEAPTADIWEQRCIDYYAGLLRLTEADKMLALVPRNQICEFATLAMQCLYGFEVSKQWGLS